MTISVILDTDLAMGAPGSDVDDGFALAMALADPALDRDWSPRSTATPTWSPPPS